jgi:hypothetical protein
MEQKTPDVRQYPQRNQEGRQNVKRPTRSPECTRRKQKGIDTDGYES